LYGFYLKGKRGNFKITYLALELHRNILVPRLPVYKDPRLYPVYDNLILGT
jgi:hypothetical protein